MTESENWRNMRWSQPDPDALIEVTRHDGDKPRVIRLNEQPAWWNVYGLYWRYVGISKHFMEAGEI